MIHGEKGLAVAGFVNDVVRSSDIALRILGPRTHYYTARKV